MFEVSRAKFVVTATDCKPADASSNLPKGSYVMDETENNITIRHHYLHSKLRLGHNIGGFGTVNSKWINLHDSCV